MPCPKLRTLTRDARLRRHYDRDLAVRLARRRDADLYVVAEGGEKLHQALGGKGTGSSTHQVGDVRLRNAEDPAKIGGLDLRLVER